MPTAATVRPPRNGPIIRQRISAGVVRASGARCGEGAPEARTTPVAIAMARATSAKRRMTANPTGSFAVRRRDLRLGGRPRRAAMIAEVGADCGGAIAIALFHFFLGERGEPIAHDVEMSADVELEREQRLDVVADAREVVFLRRRGRALLVHPLDLRDFVDAARGRVILRKALPSIVRQLRFVTHCAQPAADDLNRTIVVFVGEECDAAKDEQRVGVNAGWNLRSLCDEPLRVLLRAGRVELQLI